jgi:hypothetical protein
LRALALANDALLIGDEQECDDLFDAGLIRLERDFTDEYLTVLTDKGRAAVEAVVRGQLEKLPDDGQLVERLRKSIVALWHKTPPGSTPELHDCLGMTWAEYQAWATGQRPVVRDTEPGDGQRLRNALMCLEGALGDVDDSNNEANREALAVAREQALVVLRDTEREHEPADQYDTAAKVWAAEQCGRVAAEAAEVLDNLLESLQRVGIEGQAGDVEDFDAALKEARDLHKRLGDPQQEHLHALRAHRHAEVLAKALDQFLRCSPPGRRLEQELKEQVEPTLQALGYPKEAGS